MAVITTAVKTEPVVAGAPPTGSRMFYSRLIGALFLFGFLSYGGGLRAGQFGDRAAVAAPAV